MEEKFPLPHLCSQVFLLDHLQVASSKESYPAINQIEASLRSINGPVFHQFNIQAFAWPSRHSQPAKTNKWVLAQGGASFWRQPCSLNFLRTWYKRAFIAGVLFHLNSADSSHTLQPFTGSVGLRCVRLSDCANLRHSYLQLTLSIPKPKCSEPH